MVLLTLCIFFFPISEYKSFYRIDFYVRNKENEVLDHVTEVYQSIAPNDEQHPPPPVIIEPNVVTSDSIILTWTTPKSDLEIIAYTVRYQMRNSEGHIEDLMDHGREVAA